MVDTLSTDQNINPETLVQVVALNNVMKVDVYTYIRTKQFHSQVRNFTKKGCRILLQPFGSVTGIIVTNN